MDSVSLIKQQIADLQKRVDEIEKIDSLIVQINSVASSAGYKSLDEMLQRKAELEKAVGAPSKNGKSDGIVRYKRTAPPAAPAKSKKKGGLLRGRASFEEIKTIAALADQGKKPEEIAHELNRTVKFVRKILSKK
jgi:hypothetical protein